MASYKYDKSVTKIDHVAFDTVHTPGTAAPDAGIYKCTGCGHEIGIAKGHNLPPQIHSQHPSSKPILWQLSVFAVHNT